MQTKTCRRNLRTLIRSVLINGMCLFVVWRRKAPTASSAKLASHTRRVATIVTCANCLLFALVLLFPSHKRLRFHLIYCAIVRLSFVCGSLVGAVQVSQRVLFFSLANEWHKKRTILVYARAECVPLRSSSVGSLKRSVEGERNRGNT